MAKLAIYYEQDDAGKDTGRVQVVDENEGEVWDIFDTEAKAEKAMAKMQAESDRNNKIKAEYLKWEKDCRTRHKITRNELRYYLVNDVCT